MDGYAFSFATVQGNSLFVVGNIPAGKERATPVSAGEAVRIMTGAPIPRGCDTVVPIENVETIGDTIRLVGDARPGSHIRTRGEDIRAGQRAIAANSLLRPQEIGMLASLGKTSVRVYRRPMVGVLATGDELLAIGSSPAPGRPSTATATASPHRWRRPAGSGPAGNRQGRGGTDLRPDP